MKKKLSDISSIRLGTPAFRVLEMSKHRDSDPTAEIYRKVRDAALFTSDVPAAMRIAVLELVKAEIVRNLQAEIDEG